MNLPCHFDDNTGIREFELPGDIKWRIACPKFFKNGCPTHCQDNRSRPMLQEYDFKGITGWNKWVDVPNLRIECYDGNNVILFLVWLVLIVKHDTIF